MLYGWCVHWDLCCSSHPLNLNTFAQVPVTHLYFLSCARRFPDTQFDDKKASVLASAIKIHKTVTTLECVASLQRYVGDVFYSLSCRLVSWRVYTEFFTYLKCFISTSTLQLSANAYLPENYYSCETSRTVSSRSLRQCSCILWAFAHSWCPYSFSFRLQTFFDTCVIHMIA